MKIIFTNDSIIILKKKFEEIKNLGWIKYEQKNTGYMGMKLEKLLNLENNNFAVADFNGIEIKTKQDNCKNEFFTLFNATPFGNNFFEIQNIVDKYGYPDKDLKDKKVFSGDVNGKCINKIGRYFKFTLKVDRINEKIILIVFDIGMNIIDDSTFWPFHILKEKLYCKNSYLALFNTKKKYVNGNTYFCYYDMNLYKLKSFEKFIDLIECGKIKVQFKVGRFKKGKRTGEIHDRGTGFQIETSNITELYDML